MKITIDLSDAQVKGIKSYLEETSGEINPKIKKSDIETEIRGIVFAALQSGAIYDHIAKHETE